MKFKSCRVCGKEGVYTNTVSPPAWATDQAPVEKVYCGVCVEWAACSKCNYLIKGTCQVPFNVQVFCKDCEKS